MSRRIVLFVISILGIIYACFGISAPKCSAELKKINGVSYTYTEIDKQSVWIIRIDLPNSMKSPVLKIPSKLGGKSVVRLGNSGDNKKNNTINTVEESIPSSTELPNQEKQLDIKKSTLVKYNWIKSDKAGKSDTIQVVLPDSVKKIKKKAFAIADEKQKYQPIKLEIPKDVKIKPYAFKCMGPAEITFEEGRTKISRNSFTYYGECGSDISITLPKSVKEIEPYSFEQIYSEKLQVYLNEELEIRNNDDVCMWSSGR